MGRGVRGGGESGVGRRRFSRPCPHSEATAYGGVLLVSLMFVSQGDVGQVVRLFEVDDERADDLVGIVECGVVAVELDRVGHRVFGREDW